MHTYTSPVLICVLPWRLMKVGGRGSYEGSNCTSHQDQAPPSPRRDKYKVAKLRQRGPRTMVGVHQSIFSPLCPPHLQRVEKSCYFSAKDFSQHLAPCSIVKYAFHECWLPLSFDVVSILNHSAVYRLISGRGQRPG